MDNIHELPKEAKEEIQKQFINLISDIAKKTKQDISLLQIKTTIERILENIMLIPEFLRIFNDSDYNKDWFTACLNSLLMTEPFNVLIMKLKKELEQEMISNNDMMWYNYYKKNNNIINTTFDCKKYNLFLFLKSLLTEEPLLNMNKYILESFDIMENMEENPYQTMTHIFTKLGIKYTTFKNIKNVKQTDSPIIIIYKGKTLMGGGDSMKELIDDYLNEFNRENNTSFSNIEDLIKEYGVDDFKGHLKLYVSEEENYYNDAIKLIQEIDEGKLYYNEIAKYIEKISIKQYNDKNNTNCKDIDCILLRENGKNDIVDILSSNISIKNVTNNKVLRDLVENIKQKKTEQKILIDVKIKKTLNETEKTKELNETKKRKKIIDHYRNEFNRITKTNFRNIEDLINEYGVDDFKGHLKLYVSEEENYYNDAIKLIQEIDEGKLYYNEIAKYIEKISIKQYNDKNNTNCKDIDCILLRENGKNDIVDILSSNISIKNVTNNKVLRDLVEKTKQKTFNQNKERNELIDSYLKLQHSKKTIEEHIISDGPKKLLDYLDSSVRTNIFAQSLINDITYGNLYYNEIERYITTISIKEYNQVNSTICKDIDCIILRKDGKGDIINILKENIIVNNIENHVVLLKFIEKIQNKNFKENNMKQELINYYMKKVLNTNKIKIEDHIIKDGPDKFIKYLDSRKDDNIFSYILNNDIINGRLYYNEIEKYIKNISIKEYNKQNHTFCEDIDCIIIREKGKEELIKILKNNNDYNNKAIIRLINELQNKNLFTTVNRHKFFDDYYMKTFNRRKYNIESDIKMYGPDDLIRYLKNNNSNVIAQYIMNEINNGLIYYNEIWEYEKKQILNQANRRFSSHFDTLDSIFIVESGKEFLLDLLKLKVNQNEYIQHNRHIKKMIHDIENNSIDTKYASESVNIIKRYLESYNRINGLKYYNINDYLKEEGVQDISKHLLALIPMNKYANHILYDIKNTDKYQNDIIEYLIKYIINNYNKNNQTSCKTFKDIILRTNGKEQLSLLLNSLSKDDIIKRHVDKLVDIVNFDDIEKELQKKEKTRIVKTYIQQYNLKNNTNYKTLNEIILNTNNIQIIINDLKPFISTNKFIVNVIADIQDGVYNNLLNDKNDKIHKTEFETILNKYIKTFNGKYNRKYKTIEQVLKHEGTTEFLIYLKQNPENQYIQKLVHKIEINLDKYEEINTKNGFQKIVHDYISKHSDIGDKNISLSVILKTYGPESFLLFLNQFDKNDKNKKYADLLINNINDGIYDKDIAEYIKSEIVKTYNIIYDTQYKNIDVILKTEETYTKLLELLQYYKDNKYILEIINKLQHKEQQDIIHIKPVKKTKQNNINILSNKYNKNLFEVTKDKIGDTITSYINKSEYIKLLNKVKKFNEYKKESLVNTLYLPTIGNITNMLLKYADNLVKNKYSSVVNTINKYTIAKGKNAYHYFYKNISGDTTFTLDENLPETILDGSYELLNGVITLIGENLRHRVACMKYRDGKYLYDSNTSFITKFNWSSKYAYSVDEYYDTFLPYMYQAKYVELSFVCYINRNVFNKHIQSIYSPKLRIYNPPRLNTYKNKILLMYIQDNSCIHNSKQSIIQLHNRYQTSSQLQKNYKNIIYKTSKYNINDIDVHISCIDNHDSYLFWKKRGKQTQYKNELIKLYNILISKILTHNIIVIGHHSGGEVTSHLAEKLNMTDSIYYNVSFITFNSTYIPDKSKVNKMNIIHYITKCEKEECHKTYIKKGVKGYIEVVKNIDAPNEYMELESMVLFNKIL